MEMTNQTSAARRRITVTNTEYVRLMRVRLGMSQTELAKKIGWARVRINMIENGIANAEQTSRLAHEIEKLHAEAEAQA